MARADEQKRVLVMGGTGAVGRLIARDLLRWTTARVILAGRDERKGASVARDLGPRVEFREAQLASDRSLAGVLRGADLALHAAGPYRKLGARLAAACVQAGVPYADISDNREFTTKVLDLAPQARARKVVLVTGAGLLPGLANVMVRMGAERILAEGGTLDAARIAYAIRGHGGLGGAALRTALGAAGRPFTALEDGRWRTRATFDAPETVRLPAPFGPTRVYGFEFAALQTLPQSFPFKTVSTKLGVVPDLFNRAGRDLGRALPKPLLTEGPLVTVLAYQASRALRLANQVLDPRAALRADVTGEVRGAPRAISYEAAVRTAAQGAAASAGAVAALMLAGAIAEPGAFPPERIVPPGPYLAELEKRGVRVSERAAEAAPEAPAARAADA